MCGRYTLFVKPEVLKERFKSTIDESNLPKLQPRYNIAPAQDVPVITSEQPRTIRFMRWGLVPSWSKDASIGNKLINARAETLLEKPSFRASFKQRRCLVLANGFYEWRAAPNARAGKQPYWIRLQSGEPFALAGLWDTWYNPAHRNSSNNSPNKPDAGLLHTCTIITTTPNSLIAPLHHRMAVILHPQEEDLWLREDVPPEELLALLKPFPDEQMIAIPVSKRVNSVGIDDASLVESLGESVGDLLGTPAASASSRAPHTSSPEQLSGGMHGEPPLTLF
jgi:putative SOS response-associated peptidase YedK